MAEPSKPSVRIELLATGDELLNGSVVDTNSPWLMSKLGELGLAVWRKTIVGDERQALIAAMRQASKESDLVVVSGGLGPTSDDLTADCAAEAAGVELRFDEGAYAVLEARFKLRGRPVSANNRKQAFVPASATVIANRFGTAPMFEQPIGGAHFYFLPGVPREYFGLAEEELLPRLRTLSAGGPVRRVKLLRTFGLPESQLDEKLADLPKLFPGLTLGYRTTLPENHGKLVVTGPPAEVEALLAQVTVEARKRLGADCFAEDDESFSAVVCRLLAEGQATLGIAESLTAGRVAALLAETPGASRVLLGGFVAYTPAMKAELLGISRELIETHGAVSAEVATAMAVAARAKTGATHAVSCTGFAGPEGDGVHPVGTVFTALVSAAGTSATRHRFLGDRPLIREFAAYATLDALRRALLIT